MAVCLRGSRFRWKATGDDIYRKSQEKVCACQLNADLFNSVRGHAEPFQLSTGLKAFRTPLKVTGR